jgi:heme/copper-type cytochrome/quinol oxidase subunit 1
VVPIGIAGAAVTAAGVLMFALDIASRGATSEPDPYGGHTLEWATASPPEGRGPGPIEPVTSATPLLDAKEASA